MVSADYKSSESLTSFDDGAEWHGCRRLLTLIPLIQPHAAQEVLIARFSTEFDPDGIDLEINETDRGAAVAGFKLVESGGVSSEPQIRCGRIAAIGFDIFIVLLATGLTRRSEGVHDRWEAALRVVPLKQLGACRLT